MAPFGLKVPPLALMWPLFQKWLFWLYNGPFWLLNCPLLDLECTLLVLKWPLLDLKGHFCNFVNNAQYAFLCSKGFPVYVSMPCNTLLFPSHFFICLMRRAFFLGFLNT